MDRVRQPLLNNIYREESDRKIPCCEDAVDEHDCDGGERWRDDICIGPTAGPDQLLKETAQRIAQENIVSALRQNELAAKSGMTISNFVETFFVPHHVLVKKLAGRSYYQAILKHVLPPEEVNRIFHVYHENSNAKLKALSGWPYLSDLRIEDCGPEHVERLISAAHSQGYSAQTVMHIRNVVSVIFSHAIRLRHYPHDNPAKTTTLPELPHRDAHLLTLTQVKEVLQAMRYPEREMTLFAMLTSLNVAEICGLQWKYVNLTGNWSNTTAEAVPPFTIAIRKLLYRGELGNVNRTRARNVPIPEPLLPILIKLSGRGRWTAPDDFVLVSRTGTPINAINITARRLRTIGNKLQMPWLTWRVFRHRQLASNADLGAQFHVHLASIYRSE